jgi:hypothetical protein
VRQGFLLMMTIALLVACSPTVDQEEVSQPQGKIDEEYILKEDYTFTEFMEDHNVSLKGADIPYSVEESFAGKPFALEGSAQLSRYYNYGFNELEGSHFVIKITKKDALHWYVYLSREKYPELFKALKKGPVDIFALASIPKEYYEMGQGHLAMAEDILVKQSEVEEKPLNDDLANYMKNHSVELTARDVLYDRKGMSNRPFALSGNAQLVTYRYASAYKDLEPTHFVLSVRDTVNKREQLWSVAFDRKEFSELYEQALNGMVHVTLTAIMPEDRFTPRAGLAAIGQEAEYESLPEKYVSPSDSAQAYMKERGVSLTGLEVLYDMSSHVGEPFLVEGTAELRTSLTEGYEDLQDHYFGIEIVEDPYGDQPVLYPRALEGWTLILHRQKYPHIYEQLSSKEYLEVMVTARVVADWYQPGQGGKAFVEDIVITNP